MFDRTRPAVLLGLLAMIGLAGCSSETTEPPGADLGGSTWEVIRDHVLEPSCARSCHVAGTRFARESNLVLTPDVAYESLVGRDPLNEDALGDGLELVSRLGPVGVHRSFLWEKINWPNEQHYRDDHPGYGSLMPLGGPALTYGELELIRRWIAAGAPREGVVADPVLLENTDRYEPAPFEGLEPPAEGEGFQMRVGPFPVPPGIEREIFVYRPLDQVEDLWLDGFDVAMRPGSHHFILYRFNQSIPEHQIPEPEAVRDLRDSQGRLVSETLGTMFYHVNIAGTQTPQASWRMPPGVAIRVPAGNGFDFNSHYVNRGSETLQGEVHVNLYTTDPAQVVHEAKTLSLNNLNIDLPPGEVTTLERRFTITERRHVFQLVSHAHEHNLDFSAHLEGGPRDGELIYYSDDWEHPPFVEFDPPLVLEAGQRIMIRATYDNWTDRTLTFGFLSEDEMMILFGLYYTD